MRPQGFGGGNPRRIVGSKRGMENPQGLGAPAPAITNYEL